MRFAELHLLKYGHFDDCRLEFPADGPDLQIILGENEVGKSTTLEAVGDLLFGFPHATPFDFRFDRQLLRVGAVIEAGDHVRLACRRKKGNVSTLVSDEEAPIDDGRLTALLHGQTRESFHRMFSLDHRRLREGGQAILDAKDDVGRAIFAAGSGLVGITRFLDDQVLAAKAVWAPRARDAAFTNAQKAFEGAKARLREAQVKPSRWEALRKAVGRSDAKLGELRLRRVEFQRQREVVERRRRVLTPIARMRLVEDEIGRLADAPEFNEEAPATVKAACLAIIKAEPGLKTAREQADAARCALEGIVVSDALLARAGDIEALRAEKGAADASLRDLPKRQADIRSHTARLNELQQELGWPVESASLARRRLPDRVKMAEIRGLIERKSGVDARLEAAEEELVGRVADFDRATRALDALPLTRDVTSLGDAIRHARTLGDVQAARAAVTLRIDAEQRRLTEAIARLNPWSGDMPTLRGLAIPPESTVTHLQNKLTGLDEDGERERAKLTDLEEQRELLKLRRTQLVQKEHAIPAETLAEARADREASWTPLRDHLHGRSTVADPHAAVDQFEAKSRSADAIADDRFQGAELAGRLVRLTEDLEQCELSIRQATGRFESINAEIAAAHAEWGCLLAPLAVDLTPRAFQSWIERRVRALEIDEALAGAHADHADLARREQQARKLLVLALAVWRVASAPEDALPLTVLLTEAERLEKDTLELKARQDRLRDQLTAATVAAERAEHQRTLAQTASDVWAQAWLPALAAGGLGDDTSLAVVRARLDLLDEIRSEADEILGFEQRVTAMEADIAAYVERLTKLATECGAPTEGRDPQEVLGELVADVDRAAKLEERHANLLTQLADADRRAAAAAEVIVDAEARLAPLFARAGVSDRELLQDLVARAEQRAQRRSELDEIAREIVSLGDGLGLDQLIAEGAGVDASALKAEADELLARIDEVSKEIEQMSQERATQANEFERLDDGPDAAIAAAEMAESRAEMEAQAETYVRKRAEVGLLRWAIDRYRSEKQAPLLKRASELFSILTLGRYCALTVDAAGASPTIFGLTADGAFAVPAARMSDGAVDQLYLALRLAAIEDAVDHGLKLPFLADDLFINYDDRRSAAGFQVLAALAAKTQVLFFTHHDHLLPVAQNALAGSGVSVCRLGA
jgi:uncharacterized protein YhaN